MSIKNESIATVNDGIIFNVDGLRGKIHREFPPLQIANYNNGKPLEEQIQPLCILQRASIAGDVWNNPLQAIINYNEELKTTYGDIIKYSLLNNYLNTHKL
ncbi:MAG: hypothetical protein CENE_00720 [Candidatus Celerinatantimonas neptuna]|nr:MAG: hypothetical protein CENE_00720 [Candidatus Celerinatantimonas neptuna]